VETDEPAQPRYPMIWAIRAVPVLLIFCTLDLTQRDPPIEFLVLTLVRLAMGVAVLVAIHRTRRDWLALSYVVFVFLTSLVNPLRGQQVLILSAIGLVVIGVDQVRQRRRPKSSSKLSTRKLDAAQRKL
jgi:hypothetical protein